MSEHDGHFKYGKIWVCDHCGVGISAEHEDADGKTYTCVEQSCGNVQEISDIKETIPCPTCASLKARNAELEAENSKLREKIEVAPNGRPIDCLKDGCPWETPNIIETLKAENARLRDIAEKAKAFQSAVLNPGKYMVEFSKEMDEADYNLSEALQQLDREGK